MNVGTQKTFTSNSCDAFNTYLKHKGCFINVKTINDTKYYHTFEKIFNTNLETESPIYNQILQQEQIELHKLRQLIQAHSGIFFIIILMLLIAYSLEINFLLNWWKRYN